MVLGVGVLCAVALAGCSESSGKPESPTKQPAPTSSSKPPSEPDRPDRPDSKLGKQAEAALDTVTVDDPEFVESGLEKVRDGVHVESLLTRGRSYRLGVSCAGKGRVELTVRTEPRPVARHLDCDGTATYVRITKAPARLAIDAEGKRDATGMVAWRISETGA
ncbi:hypothetical protein [Streptomyces cavernicola]|uniref:Lipoprotein n=1 Tax=Streptomyces cavernicola TaxID=3043613 RepID=A0ABT6SN80_9ACTN|nr:hypothetical protein [Streptomyces sp. B-S-A6]MDI3409299.1 hypothetical protein [Streptomyces sp. B-S-A6]